MANVLIQLKRGKKATWETQNPTLAYGEPGYEKETGKLKIGDGETAWNDLPYLTNGGGEDIIINLNIENGEGENSIVQNILDADASFPVPTFFGANNDDLEEALASAWEITGERNGSNEFIAGAFNKAALATNGKSQAYGSRSSAFGSRTVAYGSGSFATGNSTLAKGNYSHTEGAYTVAAETSAHAEGQFTLANDIGAHAEGMSTWAKSYACHAEGY
jgi:hypothetical protein